MSRFDKFADADARVSVAGNVETSRIEKRYLFVQVTVGYFVSQLRSGGERRVLRVCEYIPVPDPVSMKPMIIRTCASRNTGARSASDLKALFADEPGLEEHITDFMAYLVEEKGYGKADLYTRKGGLFTRSVNTDYALYWGGNCTDEDDRDVCKNVRELNAESIESGSGRSLISVFWLNDSMEEDVAIQRAADFAALGRDTNGELLEEEQQLLDATPKPEAS